MTLKELSLALQVNPEFQALDYRGQQTAMFSAFAKNMSENTEFQVLPPETQAMAVMEAVSRLSFPVFKDNWELTRRVANYGQRAIAGDAKAQAAMLGFTEAYRLGTGSVIVKALGTKLLYPALDFMLGRPSKGQGTFADIAWALTAPGAREASDIAEYFDGILSKDKRTSTLAGILRVAGPILGAVYDTVALNQALVGTWKQPFAVGKLAMDAGAKVTANASTRLGETLGVMLGRGLHATAEGLIGFSQNIAAELLDKAGKENASFLELAYNNAKYFGGFFLGDIAFNMVAGVVWPMMKGFARTLKGGLTAGFDQGEALKQLDQLGVRTALESAFSGKELDPALWTQIAKLSPESAEAFLRGAESFAIFKHVPRVDQLDEIFKMAAFANGFLAEASAKGWRIRRVTEAAWQEFGDLPKARAFIETQLGGTGKLAPDAAAAYAASTRARIQKVFRGSLSEGATQNVDVLTRLAAPVNREFRPDKVRAFAQAFLAGKSVSSQTYRKIATRAVEDGVELLLDEQTLAKIPRTIASGAEEVKAVSDMVKALDEVAKASPGAARNQLGRKLQALYGTSLAHQKLFTPAWTEYAAAKALHGTVETLADGRVKLVMGGSEELFENSDALAGYLIRRTTTAEELYSWLKREQGLSLSIAEDGTVSVYRNRMKLYEAPDYQTLLDQHADLLPKAASYLGPELTFVDDQVKVLRYVRATAVGRYEDLLRHLNGFYRGKPGGSRVPLQMGKAGHLTLYTPGGKHLEVYLDDLADRFSFNSLSEAHEFIAKGAKDWSVIQRSARHKGMRVVPYMGKYLVYGSEGAPQVLPDLAGVQAAMRNVPLPEWMPELSGISEELVNAADVPGLESFRDPISLAPKDPDAASPIFWRGLRKVFGERQWIRRGEEWHRAAQHLYRPVDAIIVDAVKNGKDPELLRLFRASESIQAAIRGQDHILGRFARTAFYLDGKLLPTEIRRKIKLLVEAPETSWTKVAADLELAAPHIEVARTLRKFFGETAEAGLAGQYGLDWEIFLTDYMPRVRKAWVENAGKLMEKDRGQLLTAAFEGRAPKELDAFFRHLRVSEIAGMALEDDPLVLLEKYIKVGNRNTFLGPLWREATDYIRANRKTLDPMELGRFELYRSQVMGVPQGYVEMLIKQAHQEIWTKLGTKFANPRLGSDIVEMGTSFVYLSALGFRPWLAIRNDLQIWTTLASRIGNEFVVEAVEKLAAATNREYIDVMLDSLKRKGIVGSQVLQMGAEGLLSRENLLKKITARGLRFMQDSDEWSRSVAYWSARARFDKALAKLDKGILKPGAKLAEQFDDLSGLYMLDPDLRNMAHELISKGQGAAASDLFAAKITEETMFPYRASQNSVAFRGVIGKLFGRFGHYPLWYVENIRRGLRYGSPAQKALFMTRFVGNSLAIYGTLQAIGIQAQDFLPWVPASFSGGPLYNMMNKTLQAMDFRKGSYQARQARGELFGITTSEGDLEIHPERSEIFGRWLPTFLIGDFLQAAKAWQEGDTYGAVLSMTGATMVVDRWTK